MHIATYLNTEGNGLKGGSAPFRCPNSEVITGFANQEAGIAYNINLGDDRFSNRPAIKLSDISAPVQTGIIAD